MVLSSTLVIPICRNVSMPRFHSSGPLFAAGSRPSTGTLAGSPPPSSTRRRKDSIAARRGAPRRGLDDRAPLSIVATAEPDRDRALYRQRIQARAIDAVPATFEVHDLLCPQRAQNGDLLLDPLTAVREAHAKGLVLHLIPADADPKNEAAPR